MLYHSPLFGVATTVIAYTIALAIHQRWPRIHPLLVACGLLAAMLLLGRIPYEDYKAGGDIIAFFLGPATVALGVPFYRQAQRIRGHLVPLTLAVAIGAAAGIGSAFALVKLAGGSTVLLRSMLPKSVTTPISIELSRQLRGDAQLTAVFTVLAGLIGSVIGPRILRWTGIQRDIALGAAIGASSHGIGTARLVRESELQAATSSLAMALCGVITSLLAIPVRYWLGVGK